MDKGILFYSVVHLHVDQQLHLQNFLQIFDEKMTLRLLGLSALIFSSSVLIFIASNPTWNVEGNTPPDSLEEDITDPTIKEAFLSKFQSAKHHHLRHKTEEKKPLTAAQKAKIIQQMKALRKQIEGDFDRNTVFEKRVDCSYPYPAASCKTHETGPIHKVQHFLNPPPFSVG